MTIKEALIGLRDYLESVDAIPTYTDRLLDMSNTVDRVVYLSDSKPWMRSGKNREYYVILAWRFSLDQTDETGVFCEIDAQQSVDDFLSSYVDGNGSPIPPGIRLYHDSSNCGIDPNTGRYHIENTYKLLLGGQLCQ